MRPADICDPEAIGYLSRYGYAERERERKRMVVRYLVLGVQAGHPHPETVMASFLVLLCLALLRFAYLYGPSVVVVRISGPWSLGPS